MRKSITNHLLPTYVVSRLGDKVTHPKYGRRGRVNLKVHGLGGEVHRLEALHVRQGLGVDVLAQQTPSSPPRLSLYSVRANCSLFIIITDWQ